MKFFMSLAVATLAYLALSAGANAQQNISPTIKAIDIGANITLHYVDEGTGRAVVFVHGSISDGGYWSGQLGHYASRYRAIAYSRRYNYPNRNPARPGYSAVVDADDLAAFIVKLHLGKVDLIGHSYGALTALIFTTKHPGMVHRLVLCEPPAVSLLEHLEGGEAASGHAMYADIEQHLVAPMKREFGHGDSEGGVRTFIDYVLQDPHAWDNMDASSHRATMRDVREWQVMMTTGHLFPDISLQAIRTIQTPTLIVSGAQSYPFLGAIDRELALLIPHNHRVIIAGAGHQMWYQQQEATRRAVDEFLKQ